MSYFEKQKQATRTITVSFRTGMTVSNGENRVSHASTVGRGGLFRSGCISKRHSGFHNSSGLPCMELGVTLFVDGPDRFGKLIAQN